MLSTDWNTECNPLEDLKNAAEIIKKSSVIKPMTLLEKLVRTRDRLYFAMWYLPDNHDEYRQQYIELKLEYEKSIKQDTTKPLILVNLNHGIEMAEKIEIEIKHPVEKEYIEAAYWLKMSMKEKRSIYLIKSTGNNGLVLSNACGFYFPKEWIKKQPELMTLQEAHKKADIGDKIYFHGRLVFTKSEKYENRPIILIEQAIEDKWHVEKAEPVVLSAEEWILNDNGCSDCKTSFPECDGCQFDAKNMVMSFNTGDQNGQLKQWLNHKPLREAVNDFMVDIYAKTLSKVDVLAHSRKIEYARSNLKPLETK